MNDDSELLRRYVDDRSDDAFTELVQRHLGLVYSTALLRVGGDAHLARDVAQKVFIDLARKAASLRGRASLTAWLYVSTHYAAAAVVRGEQRRKARETEAHLMQTLLQEPNPAPDWAHLRPSLDEVFVTLREDEREAIALRFFEKRSLAEIGATLRLTEDATRKRIERALEKLRAKLGRRGITSTSALLSLALGDAGASVAPVGLAANIAGHALAQSAAVGAASVVGAWLTSTSALTSAALLVGGFAVSYQYRVNSSLETQLARAQADAAVVTSLRRENYHLAREVAEIDDLRRTQQELAAQPTPAALPAPAVPFQTQARADITITAKGTISWGKEPVTLEQFLARLKALHDSGAGDGARLHIRNLSQFPQASYVIEEARKAGLDHVVVDSVPIPADQIKPSWF